MKQQNYKRIGLVLAGVAGPSKVLYLSVSHEQLQFLLELERMSQDAVKDEPGPWLGVVSDQWGKAKSKRLPESDNAT